MENNMIFLRGYLDENLGDDLFLQIVADRYSEKNITVLLHKEYHNPLPENINPIIIEKAEKKESDVLDIMKKYHIPRRLYPPYMRYEKRKLRSFARKAKYNIFVTGSGFMENSQWGYWKYLHEKKYFRNNIYLLGCNFGPFTSKSYLSKYTQLFKKAKDVCFRDSYSYRLFPQLSNVRFAYDIVFTYKLGEKYILPDDYGKYAVISLVNLYKDNKKCGDEKAYIKLLVGVSNYLTRSGMKVVFAGFCKNQGDDLIINQVVQLCENKKNISIYNYPDIDCPSMMSLFKNAELVVSSRYHAAIIAMLYQRKLYVLSYSEKTVHVLQDIDPNIKYLNLQQNFTITAEEFLKGYGYCIEEERLKKIKQNAETQFSLLDSVLLGGAHHNEN